MTQTITIRCTAGSAYTVGLSDGSNFSSGWRRMRQGASRNYLRYELYKAPTSSDRWGGVGAHRRSSVMADSNPSIHDGTTAQGYTYRAEIDPTQATPPAGTYHRQCRGGCPVLMGLFRHLPGKPGLG